MQNRDFPPNGAKCEANLTRNQCVLILGIAELPGVAWDVFGRYILKFELVEQI